MGRARRDSSPLADAILGALAGTAAVWVMDRVDWFNFLHEDPDARRQTKAVRPGGMDPGHVVADKVASAVGVELEPKDQNPAGVSVHYSFGVLPAALYGVMRHKAPGLTAGHGTLFGIGMFLLHDEGLNTITGLAAKPQDYPWQAHARGFVAHLVYGVVLESALRAADRLTRDDDRR